MKILKELLGAFIISLVTCTIARAISDTFTSGYIAGLIVICINYYLIIANEK